jgi:hypothetical protein
MALEAKEVQEVKNFKIFLEKSEYGVDHVYQLHRKLGTVFIDAAFYDEYRNLFTCKVVFDSPRFIHSELKWDEHHFPYELETYQVRDKQIQIKLYRPFDSTRTKSAFKHFLEEVVPLVQLDIPGVPQFLVDNFLKVKSAISTIRIELDGIKCKFNLDEDEQKAIDVFFGGVGIWNNTPQFFEEDLNIALVEYLFSFIQKHGDLYSQIHDKETKIRQQTLHEMEEKLVQEHIKALEEFRFIKGYIVS